MRLWGHQKAKTGVEVEEKRVSQVLKSSVTELEWSGQQDVWRHEVWRRWGERRPRDGIWGAQRTLPHLGLSTWGLRGKTSLHSRGEMLSPGGRNSTFQAKVYKGQYPTSVMFTFTPVTLCTKQWVHSMYPTKVYGINGRPVNSIQCLYLNDVPQPYQSCRISGSPSFLLQCDCQGSKAVPQGISCLPGRPALTIRK